MTSISSTLGTTVAQRIAQALPRLTRSHRQVADYVLTHPLQVATLPIDELAEVAGVSVATANRFARALGFEGYASFRGELVRGFEPLIAPVEQLRGNLAQPSTVAEVFATALEESHRNIEATRRTLDYGSCERAVQYILDARTVFIAGYGASAHLAGLLHHGLDAYCADLRLLPTVSGATHGARSLSRGTPGDLLVAIGFPRYLTDTVTLAGIARAHGVPVLVLTDRPSSPLAPLADVVLYAQAETRYRPNCETSVLALIEALSSAVALRTPGAFQLAGKVVESVVPWLHGAQGLRTAATAETVAAPTPVPPVPESEAGAVIARAAT
ncbi:MurR/RpiR family transcriptional regulator [Variovorax ginsengisoli]|uniref:DNA-binding MurR/RpiR family transcriptional regulator n=1 Tax=Variovorax ginsengisoli TaxID=363844 RepID=A0ABT9S8W7_9BURK|nr:MurR/RpiR family transcriptional regulator [Variovorax ginsengisoli]MDP9900211.1 DNA-binding MurR/RpiR family transcriptional regulator [Variovorax ginsengisoli]